MLLSPATAPRKEDLFCGNTYGVAPAIPYASAGHLSINKFSFLKINRQAFIKKT